jgi:hypothetical protein
VNSCDKTWLKLLLNLDELTSEEILKKRKEEPFKNDEEFYEFCEKYKKLLTEEEKKRVIVYSKQ